MGLILTHNIANASWAMFRILLAYKCEWYGKCCAAAAYLRMRKKESAVCAHENKGLAGRQKLNSSILPCAAS